MAKYKILYDREGCIGAAACAAVSERWVIAKDGKADLSGSAQDDAGWFIAEIGEEELQKEIEAAKACPVLVIHIKDENGNQIV
ncbi:MAG TPA: ferredoxin [archaeon]|nr:ferredoxin [archaeon]